jgi:hypothetical protein
MEQKQHLRHLHVSVGLGHQFQIPLMFQPLLYAGYPRRRSSSLCRLRDVVLPVTRCNAYGGALHDDATILHWSAQSSRETHVLRLPIHLSEKSAVAT